MKLKTTIQIVVAFTITAVVVLSNFAEDEDTQIYTRDAEPVVPNWAAISAWPPLPVNDVNPTPDPNQRFTAVVLDDSGSMGNDITAAKAAVVESLSAMAPTDAVAVVALNRGVVLDFLPVAEATTALPTALAPIQSEGSTPLTASVALARGMLEQQAAVAQGFGTYRMIVTTDGAADDPQTLRNEIEAMAAETPIQIATIGIGVDSRHVLRRDDLGDFVDVGNVAALGAALQAAVAENTSFAAITAFSREEN